MIDQFYLHVGTYVFMRKKKSEQCLVCILNWFITMHRVMIVAITPTVTRLNTRIYRRRRKGIIGGAREYICHNYTRLT